MRAPKSNNFFSMSMRSSKSSVRGARGTSRPALAEVVFCRSENMRLLLGEELKSSKCQTLTKISKPSFQFRDWLVLRWVSSKIMIVVLDQTKMLSHKFQVSFWLWHRDKPWTLASFLVVKINSDQTWVSKDKIKTRSLKATWACHHHHSRLILW